MKTILKKTSDIKPYINNPRKQLNVDKVADSIKEFGFQQPIVVDNNNIIIVGHTRYQAAKQLKLKKVPVVIADLSKIQAKAYRIADNKLAQDNFWDLDKLQIELNDIFKNDYAILNTGFDKDELYNFLNKSPKINNDIDNTEIIDSDLKASHKCPSCGYEFD